MFNVFLAMLPLFFWNFTTPKPLWAFTMVVANGFIQGYIYASRQRIRVIVEAELKKLEKEIDK